MSDRWCNWIEELETRGEHVRPRSLAELIAAVEDAVNDNKKLHPVGSGHSTTLAAKPVEGHRWLDCDELDRPLRWGITQVPTGDLVRVEAGMKIAELNAWLAERGRAMPVLGSYDGQTVAGVLSTATHGSGLRHGPICDAVVAIELVVVVQKDGKPTVRVARIEPSAGITHPPTFADQKTKRPELARYDLYQDDGLFYGAVVGLGSLGILYAVTLRTREAFWLTETRLACTWDQLRPRFVQKAQAPRNAEYLDYTIFPYAMQEEIRVDGVRAWKVGDVPCVVTQRVASPPEDRAPPRRVEPKPWADELADVFGTGILEHVALRCRRAHRRVLAKELFRRGQGACALQSSASHVIMKTSLGPHVKATSAELWLPLAKAPAAVDKIIELAEKNQRSAEDDDIFASRDESLEWVHSSPIGVRFVGRSKHWLAPSSDGPRCTIEIPLLLSTRMISSTQRSQFRSYRKRMLRTLERELSALGARPHWGQVHFFETKTFEQLYPKHAAKFRALRARFDVTRTFANELTDQIIG